MAVRTWKKEWEEGLRWKNMVVVGGELLSLSLIAKGKNKKGLIGLTLRCRWMRGCIHLFLSLNSSALFSAKCEI